MADSSATWDWIIVGGGIAGTVLASRLHEKNPAAKILLIEAGEGAHGRSDLSLVTATNLIGGEFDWDYSSAPQQGLDGRVVQSAAGKGLGGGSIINTCTSTPEQRTRRGGTGLTLRRRVDERPRVRLRRLGRGRW